jgi:hypothetical protein
MRCSLTKTCAESLIYCFLELYLGDLPWKFGSTAQYKTEIKGNACAQAADTTAKELHSEHGNQTDPDREKLNVTGETETRNDRQELDMTVDRDVNSAVATRTDSEGQPSDVCEEYSYGSCSPNKLNSTSVRDTNGEQACKTLAPGSPEDIHAKRKKLNDADKYMVTYEW